jgi:hypothetical protein
MGLSIFQIGLTLSFLVTLIVVLRLYRGVRILNARVSILSNLVRDLRQAQNKTAVQNEVPGEESTQSTEDATAQNFMKDLEEERSLQREMRRDFSLAKSNSRSRTPARSARNLRGMPAKELQSTASSPARLARRSSQSTTAKSTSAMRQKRVRPKPLPRPNAGTTSENELSSRLKKLESQLAQTKDKQRLLLEKNNRLESQCDELNSMNDFLEDRFSEQEQENILLRKKRTANS